MQINKSTIPMFSIALAMLFLAACSGGANQPANTGASAVKDYPVVTVVPGDVTLYSEYPATVEGQQNIEIRPKIDGYIQHIYVDEGATVKKGQLLFRIDAPQYEQEVRTADANIKIAHADVNTARMQVNKVRPLVERGIISKFELESAEYNLQAKQARLAQAQAALANAKINLGYTLVRSPVDGIVGTIPYRIGSLVSSNTAQPLTTVANTGNIYAYFSITERQALAFSGDEPGATLQSSLKAMPPVSLILSNGAEFPVKGRIETASGLVNTQTGSVRVRATFSNPGSIVQSGSTGLVRIPLKLQNALTVPQKATFEIQGRRFVYVLESTGTVKSTEIKVAEQNDGQYFIVEHGLKPNDRIVLEGVATLKDGVTIKARPVADSSFTAAI